MRPVLEVDGLTRRIGGVIAVNALSLAARGLAPTPR